MYGWLLKTRPALFHNFIASKSVISSSAGMSSHGFPGSIAMKGSVGKDNSQQSRGLSKLETSFREVLTVGFVISELLNIRSCRQTKAFR